MSKPILLEMVQDIMSALSFDEINSINDTSESLQIATVFKTVYSDLITNKDWDHLKRPLKLIPYSDSSKPTHMTLDEEINKLVEGSVYYNKVKVGDARDTRWGKVDYISNDAFLRMTNSRNDELTNTDVIFDPTGVQILIKNDSAPTYFTSFDDVTWVFDSYDSAIDSTLQGSKMQAVAYFSDTLLIADETVANLPQKAFSLFYNQVLSTCSLLFDNKLNSKAEQEVGRQNRWLAQNESRTHKINIFEHIKYGRR